MNQEQIMLGQGAIPSIKDQRDWTLASAGATTSYPDNCFIDQTMMKVNMQSKLGCCVGCTFESVVRLILIGKGYTQEEIGELSFRFVYAVAKALDGYEGEGTRPSLVAKIVRKYGVPLAKYCPNDVTLPHEQFVYGRNLANIPAEAFRDALTRRSGADFEVPVSFDGIKQAINYAKENKGGIAILRNIGDSYWKNNSGINSWNKDDILPIRLPENYTGGHEEMLFGYDHDTNGRMRIYWLNSWSEAWGDNGRAWEYADIWIKNIREIRVVVPEVPTVNTFKYKFTKTLIKGAQGADVVALQHCLKLESCYPEGVAFTGFFGDKTFMAVKQFQEKYAKDILVPNNLTKGTGNFGLATMKKMNELYNS